MRPSFHGTPPDSYDCLRTSVFGFLRSSSSHSGSNFTTACWWDESLLKVNCLTHVVCLSIAQVHSRQKCLTEKERLHKRGNNHTHARCMTCRGHPCFHPQEESRHHAKGNTQKQVYDLRITHKAGCCRKKEETKCHPDTVERASLRRQPEAVVRNLLEFYGSKGRGEVLPKNESILSSIHLRRRR